MNARTTERAPEPPEEWMTLANDMLDGEDEGCKEGDLAMFLIERGWRRSVVGEPLDVERLVAALIEVGNRDERVGIVVHNPHLAARNLIAEYRRLLDKAGEDGGA